MLGAGYLRWFEGTKDWFSRSRMSKSPNIAALDRVQAFCGKVLRCDGFRKRGRSFNRPHEGGLVGVITFFPMPSWSSLHGAFNVELGVFLPCVASIEHPEKTAPGSWYQTWDCAVRTSLPDLAGLPGDHLWELESSPDDLANDVSDLLTRIGCPFLAEFRSYPAVATHYATHGSLPGANLHRSALLAAMVHHQLGDDESARECFATALETDHTDFREYVSEIQQRFFLERG